MILFGSLCWSDVSVTKSIDELTTIAAAAPLLIPVRRQFHISYYLSVVRKLFIFIKQSIHKSQTVYAMKIKKKEKKRMSRVKESAVNWRILDLHGKINVLKENNN